MTHGPRYKFKVHKGLARRDPLLATAGTVAKGKHLELAAVARARKSGWESRKQRRTRETKAALAAIFGGGVTDA